jgi:general secretion pathway protein D
VLLITPRVLRSDATRQPALTEFRGGTENAIGGGLAAPFTPSAPEQTPPLPPPPPALPADTQPPPPPPPALSSGMPPALPVDTQPLPPADAMPQIPPPPALVD